MTRQATKWVSPPLGLFPRRVIFCLSQVLFITLLVPEPAYAFDPEVFGNALLFRLALLSLYAFLTIMFLATYWFLSAKRRPASIRGWRFVLLLTPSAFMSMGLFMLSFQILSNNDGYLGLVFLSIAFFITFKIVHSIIEYIVAPPKNT